MTTEIANYQDEASVDKVNDNAEHASSWAQNLPNLLRILGAGALVAGMYSFLVKGWDSAGSDVIRYLLLLAHTGVLVGIGLTVSRFLKEAKSARLLLTLALVSVPANFAILGALIYSTTDAASATLYPSYVAWVADSFKAAISTSAGAMLVLIPASLLGFTVLLRNMSWRLTGLFLASNAMLLIPVRDSAIVAILTLGLSITVIYFSRQMANNNIAAKTREGITALLLQLLPIAVLVGRSLSLYSAEAFLLVILAFIAFLTLRQTSSFFDKNTTTAKMQNLLSLIPAIAIAPLTGLTLIDAGCHAGIVAPISILVTSLMIYDIAHHSSYSAVYHRTAAGILSTVVICNTVIFNSSLATLAAIVIGVVVLAFGIKQQQRSILAAGIAITATAVIQQLIELVQHFNLMGWGTLAGLGIVAIVVAAVIESQGGSMKLKLSNMKTQLKEWEA